MQQEVKELGFDIVRAFPTGVELKVSVNDTIKLNLNLRTASQILYSLKEFSANNPTELYEELSTIAWEELIQFDGYFSVSSNVDNETISTPLFANVKVKDAIVDRIKDKKVCARILVRKTTKLSFTSTGRMTVLKFSLIPLEKHWPSMVTVRFRARRPCWRP
ncbi:THUMP domain-containing protein [Sphingobacterium sp. E70]|uniref:THUMP domain-containing protein n=1 Tax=Sphingobacterium sp. E70 TaxID=2853439 RepID=UPI00359C5832